MSWVKVPNAGSVGVNKDLSWHELPINAWTDCENIRFLDGYAHQFNGHGEVYDSPSFAPQYVMPINISSARYWIYTTAAKTYCVTITAGAAVHTDITHATPRTGVVNQWTGTSLSGIPILNVGDAAKVPMSWDLNTANKFVDLANWPASTYCKSLRAYKNFLVALNITKSTTNYPFMIKWSHPADPGAVPASWDHTDATKDAGELDLAEGHDAVVDGLQLRESFMIYKEASIWRMDYVGGVYVFNFTKVLGNTGAMNRNCIVEVDGLHVVLTGSDIIAHDGQSAYSVLDKQTRRWLFQNIDVDNIGKCFVFKNPFYNEVFICFPQVGSSVCDMAVIWNYKDKTISIRELPNVNHANYGPVENGLTGNWNQDSASWDSDITLWGAPDIVPSISRVLMGSSDTKLFMLDASASFNGTLPAAYLERRGLSFNKPDEIKLVKSIRPRIQGNTGETVIVKIGSQSDPYAEPTYTSMTHTIGSTVADNCLVAGRYISVRFETGTSYQWRLDSYDLDIETVGSW